MLAERGKGRDRSMSTAMERFARGLVDRLEVTPMHTSTSHRIIVSAALVIAAAACSSRPGSAASAPPAAQPGGAASPQLGSNRKAYVGLFGDGSVAVLDTVTSQVLDTVPVSAPDGLAITPDGKKLYVSSGDTGTVRVIATDDDSVVASIEVGAKPAGLALTPDGRRLVASVGGAGQAVIIDTSSDAVLKRVSVAQAHASCISDDGRLAYVGSQAAGAPAVVVVDIAGEAPPASLRVDRSPRMLACAPGKIYFTAVGLDAVEVIDPSTGALATPIPSGGSPHDVRATPDGKLELVVSQTAGDLELIDPATSTVVARVPTGKLPHWITVSRDGALAYVTNEGDNDIAVVDLAARRVTSKIPIGAAPRKMAIQP
jgi:YVTN family beta-propeller protein